MPEQNDPHKELPRIGMALENDHPKELPRIGMALGRDHPKELPRIGMALELLRIGMAPWKMIGETPSSTSTLNATTMKVSWIC
jgi:hypothetical protein